MSAALHAIILASLVLFLATANRAHAHELSMAVLRIEQVDDDRFVTSWERAPRSATDAATAYRLAQPIFPSHCRFAAPDLDCTGGGLFGELGFSGIGTACSSAVINVVWRGRSEPQTYSFSSSRPTLYVSGDTAQEGALARIAANFTRLGVEHILFGWDHLLFVLGLLWLVRAPKSLLQTISAFTVAHSLTLTAATFGWTELPSAPVEAAIALSIVFIAVEAVKLRRGDPPGLSVRRPWLVAFSFGLLHGFGFASALSEISLAKSHVAPSLLFFNVGVELGQLAFVVVICSLRAAIRRFTLRPALRLEPAMHYAAGTLAAFWFFERLAAFWS